MLHRASLLPALGAVAASWTLALVGVPASAEVAPGPGETPATVGRAAAASPAGAATPVLPRAARAARAARAEGATPLAVTIDTMTPSYVPRRGPVQVTGSVTNHDDAPWRDVNTFAFVSEDPLLTAADLAAAADTDEAADVGGRITEPGTYDTLDLLEPGETAQFSITVPSAALRATEPGVYWFGVHALGEGPDGRAVGADGRARTFLPLVEPTGRAVGTALVLPLRHPLWRSPAGRLTGERVWGRLLAPDGRLGALVDFGTSAGSRPISWLLDPALPDAVAALAAGNPPRSIAATTPDRSPGEPGETPSAGSGSSPGAAAPGDGPADEDPGTTETTANAAAWLQRLEEGLGGAQVLALPYGDVDVAATARNSPALYERARERSSGRLQPFGLTTTPAVGPPTGYLDAAGLALGEPGEAVLVSDRMLPPGSPTLVRIAGRPVVATSSGAASGGPGPDDRLSTVALRQRILAEAAVRLLSPGPQQLAALLPQDWVPASTTSFFDGLDVDWLRLTTVAGLGRRPAGEVRVEDLAYPRAEVRREVDAANFASANALIRVGTTLQDVLVDNTDLATEVTDQALTSTSYAARRHPDGVRAATDRAAGYVGRQLRSIRIQAPRAVTLSSASGRFAATITNGLDQAVAVGIQATSDQPLSITVPATVELGPGGQTTVLINATTRRPGIHNVTLRLTDGAGMALGGSDTLPIRSAQVSNVIWVILGTGIALLFGAIAVRLVRRVRAATRTGRETA